MLARASSILGLLVLGVFAGCSSSSSSGSGNVIGNSCPCTVGNSGLHFTLACGQNSCITLNGQLEGYRCESDGAHEDMSVCTSGTGGSGTGGSGTGGSAGTTGSGGSGGSGATSSGGTGGGSGCVTMPMCDGVPPACGSSANACFVAAACATCSGGGLCNVQNACFKPGVQSIAIFGNYKGGAVGIDVDKHVPGLAIGLVSYQPMQVTITGQYASDVVAVFHAGYDPGTTVSGVSPTKLAEGLREKMQSDAGPAGSLLICDTGSAGCAAASDVETFFTSHLGGSVLLHRCQYGSYSGALAVSQGGSCP